jgi:endonuclease YncB( thermonuclease family)
MAVTIPATPGSMLAASPSAPPVAAQPVSQPVGQSVAASPAEPPTPPAVAWWRCIGVTDGDTLTCLDETGRQQKLGLAGIDAPEPGQPYGREARESLAEVVFGKRIAVAVSGRDAAGQAIGQVSVDGRDVSAWLVAEGAAWADPTTGSSLMPEQQQAQQARKGLWSEETPQPPWEFRNAGESPWQPAA